MSEFISNCCSAPMPDHADSDLCPQCKEHCTILKECSDCEDGRVPLYCSDKGVEYGVCMICHGEGWAAYREAAECADNIRKLMEE